MVAKYIPCYHCGNKYEDVNVAPGFFSVEEKVVGLGYRAILEAGNGALQCSSQWRVEFGIGEWNLALVTSRTQVLAGGRRRSAVTLTGLISWLISEFRD
jgi:hypothetical protein